MKSSLRPTTGLLLAAMMLLSMVMLSAAGPQPEDVHKVSMEEINTQNRHFRLAESLSDFDMVTFELNPNKFNESVHNNKTIMLTLEGENIELNLHQTYVMGKDPKVIVENESGVHFIDAPYFHTYHGEVVGRDDSRVAITTGNNLLIGMIDVDDDPYYIELTKEEVKGKTVHAVYRKKNIISDPDAKPAYCGVDDENVDSTNLVSIEKTESSPLRSTTQIKMLPCYDHDFRDLFGDYSDAQAEISDMINEANLEYDNHGTELTFDYYKRYAYLEDNTSQGMINFFKEDIPPYRDITDSDLATLFYGDEFVNETIIGRGSVYNGSAERAYSVLQMAEETGTHYSATYDDRCILLTHELGHNFGAQHDESYNWTAQGMNYSTVMHTPFYNNSTHQLKMIYSDGDTYGDQDHDNAEYIIAHKATIAAFRTP